MNVRESLVVVAAVKLHAVQSHAEYFQSHRNIWARACKLPGKKINLGGCGGKRMAVICEYSLPSDVCAEIRRLKAGVCVQRLCICPLASAQARHPIILFAQGRI